MTKMLFWPSTVAALRRWSKALGMLRGLPKVPTAILFVVLVVAVFAPMIAPHGAERVNLDVREKPPVFFEGGSTTYILGTDRQGRDVLSRIIMGTRISLSVSALAIGLGGLFGSILGLVSGYQGRWVDALIMRAVDVWMAFPTILLALVLAVTVGPSFWMVVIILALSLWARYARLVRGEVLSLKERDFVALALVGGASSIRIIFVHLLPNVVNSIVVLSTLQVGWAIIVEAALSFLGVGVPPPTPTWGGMVSEGRNFIETLWWISVFPGIAIMLVVLSINMFGDWLRDLLDPKLSQV